LDRDDNITELGLRFGLKLRLVLELRLGSGTVMICGV